MVSDTGNQTSRARNGEIRLEITNRRPWLWSVMEDVHLCRVENHCLTAVKVTTGNDYTKRDLREHVTITEPFYAATEVQNTQKPATTLCLHPRQSTASPPTLLWCTVVLRSHLHSHTPSHIVSWGLPPDLQHFSLVLIFPNFITLVIISERHRLRLSSFSFNIRLLSSKHKLLSHKINTLPPQYTRQHDYFLYIWFPSILTWNVTDCSTFPSVCGAHRHSSLLIMH
jgi:hypothetical protein